MDVLSNTATRDGESDRQMIVLALAHLAVERPGWHWTCRDMAVERFGAGAMFDDFLKFRQNELVAPPPVTVPPEVAAADDGGLVSWGDKREKSG